MLSLVFMRALQPGEIGIWKCSSFNREELETGDKPSEHREDRGNRFRATLVEGKCTGHCAIPDLECDELLQNRNKSAQSTLGNTG